MLEFVSKRQYWKLLDDAVDKQLAQANFPWHLKSVQDVVAYHLLDNPTGLAIGEIGGGESRLLPVLAAENQCTNIEKFEGRDGGPGEEIEVENVRNVHAFVGEFSEKLEPGEFDLVVSVSVVEHIPNDSLEGFIRDCRRILKPGGRMIHLVDMYLNGERVPYNMGRIGLYTSAFADGLFEPEAAPQIVGANDLVFDESYCTNPDNMMYMWNRVAPALRELRETSQSVTLTWAGRAA